MSIRGGSRTAATSKMEHFVIIVNGFQALTIITKCSILDVTAVLDPPLPMPALRKVSLIHLSKVSFDGGLKGQEIVKNNFVIDHLYDLVISKYYSFIAHLLFTVFIS